MTRAVRLTIPSLAALFVFALASGCEPQPGLKEEGREQKSESPAQPQQDRKASSEEEASSEHPEGSSTGATFETSFKEGEGLHPVEVVLREFEIRMPRSVPAGPTTFRITNKGDTKHGFEIEGKELHKGLEHDLKAGETATLEAKLDPGRYHVYCPVGNHEEKGMSMELEVTE